MTVTDEMVERAAEAANLSTSNWRIPPMPWDTAPEPTRERWRAIARAALEAVMPAADAFSAKSDFLSMTDQSNWPEMQGDFFKGYSSAMEEVYEAVMEWWGPLSATTQTADERGEVAPEPSEEVERLLSDATLARVAAAIEPELDVSEAVLASPTALRRMKAQRVARVALRAALGGQSHD